MGVADDLQGDLDDALDRVEYLEDKLARTETLNTTSLLEEISNDLHIAHPPGPVWLCESPLCRKLSDELQHD